jgi:hypothetical protein
VWVLQGCEMRLAKDAYYFSHDSNAKDDPKVVMMIEQMGLEGFGIYWVLIEILRDQPTYKYPLALLPAMARRYNTTAEKMKIVVGGYGLFQVDENEFFSLSLMERMGKMNVIREKRIIAGKKSAEKRLMIKGNPTNIEQVLNTCITNDEQLKEKKVKEKKVKEIKELYSDQFELFWSEYPKGGYQNSKVQSFKNFSNLIKKKNIDIDNLIQAAKNYAIDCNVIGKSNYFYKASNFMGQNEYYKSYLPETWIPEKPNKSQFNNTKSDVEEMTIF